MPMMRESPTSPELGFRRLLQTSAGFADSPSREPPFLVPALPPELHQHMVSLLPSLTPATPASLATLHGWPLDRSARYPSGSQPVFNSSCVQTLGANDRPSASSLQVESSDNILDDDPHADADRLCSPSLLSVAAVAADGGVGPASAGTGGNSSSTGLALTRPVPPTPTGTVGVSLLTTPFEPMQLFTAGQWTTPNTATISSTGGVNNGSSSVSVVTVTSAPLALTSAVPNLAVPAPSGASTPISMASPSPPVGSAIGQQSQVGGMTEVVFGELDSVINIDDTLFQAFVNAFQLDFGNVEYEGYASELFDLEDLVPSVPESAGVPLKLQPFNLSFTILCFGLSLSLHST
ncbi:unnamed protein product [Protopolystoma xenopodis]|uniref:Uncharacterized protein n=1 Tax=Protopolystoma xenopodis TaxID=117903 RepID=A0A3S5A3U4_9PLAT|nr:unnamed protein product [Protopolystoma xenopodis]